MEGRIALVTGGGSGIGLATARLLLTRGAQVVVADRERGATPDEARFVRCDVSNPAEVANLFASVEHLDIAVNNAGVEGGRGTVDDYDFAEWQRVLAINLTGVFLCMQQELRLMLKGGGGAIVNVSSIYGERGAANAPAYTTAKHGVLGLTRSAALAYAERGIRVNAVCPGYIETPMVMERGLAAGSDPEKLARLVDRQPMKRLGRAEEIAETIVWLASDAASLVNGAALFADGGLTAKA